MPSQTGQSGLYAKLGKKLIEGHKEHAGEEITYGQVELPAGIEGGVAQLVDCKFDRIKPGKTNAGEYYFYAAGVVKTPEEHDGVPCAGMRTSIMEVLCDTPTRARKTVADHIGWVRNMMGRLGVNVEEFDLDANPRAYEDAADALREIKPHVLFRTWKGDKQTTGAYAGREPRVNHDWVGLHQFEGNGDEAALTAVDDQTGAAPDEPEDQDAGEDLAALAALADGQDAAACKRLTELAMEAGASEDAVAEAKSWGEVVEMIEAGVPQDEPAPAPTEPEKGGVVEYKPLVLDAKTKKRVPAKKAVDCEVTAVYKKNKTVDLLNGIDKKTTYKGVKWSDVGF